MSDKRLTFLKSFGLQAKLMLALAFVVTTIVCPFGYYWFQSQQESLSIALESRAVHMVNLLSKTIARPMWNTDLEAIADQLDAVMTVPEIFSVMLYERDSEKPLLA